MHIASGMGTKRINTSEIGTKADKHRQRRGTFTPAYLHNFTNPYSNLHNKVDGIIHYDEPKSSGAGRGIRMPAVEKDGNVMIPVQEDERLLVNDNKEGINQFGKLAETEQLNPKAGRARTELTFGIVADVIPEGHVIKIVGELRCRSDHSDEGEQTQAEIPHGQRAAPRERLAAVKVGPTANNEDGIQDACDNWHNGIVLRPIPYGHGVVVDLPSGVYENERTKP
jgi:hypothetical protein